MMKLGADYGLPKRTLAKLQRQLWVSRIFFDTRKRWKTLNELGNIYKFYQRYGKAADAHARAFGIAMSMGHHPDIRTSLTGLEDTLTVTQKYEELITYQRQALNRLTKLNPAPIEHNRLLLIRLANNLYLVGRLEEAQAAFEQLLERARHSRNISAEAQALHTLGYIAWAEGKPQEAGNFYRSALAQATQAGQRRSILQHLSGLVAVHTDQGRLTQASQLCESARLLVRANAHTRENADWAGRLAVVQGLMGHFEQALSLYAQALEFSDDVLDRHFRGLWLCGRAEVYVYLGEFERATDSLKQSRPFVLYLADHYLSAVYLDVKALVNVRLRHYDQAVTQLEKVLTLAHKARERRLAARILANLGYAQTMTGRGEEGLENCQQGLEIARTMQSLLSEAICLHWQGRTYAALNRHEEASRNLREARRMFEDFGASYFAREIDSDLSSLSRWQEVSSRF